MKLGERRKRRRLEAKAVVSPEERTPSYNVRDVIRSDVNLVLSDYVLRRYVDQDRGQHMFLVLELALLFPEAKRFVLERKADFMAYMQDWNPHVESNKTAVPLLFAQIFPEEKERFRAKILDGYTELHEDAVKKFGDDVRLIYSAEVLLIFCTYAQERREEWKEAYAATVEQDLKDILDFGKSNRFDLLSRAAIFCLLYPEKKAIIQKAFSGMRELFAQRVQDRLYTSIGSAVDLEIVFGETLGPLDQDGKIQQSGQKFSGRQALPERLTA